MPAKAHIEMSLKMAATRALSSARRVAREFNTRGKRSGLHAFNARGKPSGLHAFNARGKPSGLHAFNARGKPSDQSVSHAASRRRRRRPVRSSSVGMGMRPR